MTTSSPPDGARRVRGAHRARARASAACLAAAIGLAAFAGAAVPASAYTYNQLNIDMQAQQNTNWCWAASGDTIAAWYGYNYSQNQFCDMAFGNALSANCPNDQATLADDQNAFGAIGISAGTYIAGTIGYGTVISEVDANRPMMARIQWASGGGHMEVIYGYDQSQNWIYWGNPWPSDYRYNWGTYDYYVSNADFSWTHTLDRIGA